MQTSDESIKQIASCHLTHPQPSVRNDVPAPKLQTLNSKPINSPVLQHTDKYSAALLWA